MPGPPRSRIGDPESPGVGEASADESTGSRALTPTGGSATGRGLDGGKDSYRIDTSESRIGGQGGRGGGEGA